MVFIDEQSNFNNSIEMAVVGGSQTQTLKENKLFKVFKSGGEMNTFLINGTTLKIFSTFNDKHMQ